VGPRAETRIAQAIFAFVALASGHGSAPAQRDISPEPGGGYVWDEGVFVARVDRDGTVAIEDGPTFLYDGLGVWFDATDMIMRARGEDPYASAKLRFLDRTRDERVMLGREHRLQQLAYSGELMRVNIDEVWATMPDPQQRRLALFQLWDECAESGEPEMVAAGASARAALVEFVQRELTGTDAYTRSELAWLNAHRTSEGLFDPYAPPGREPRSASHPITAQARARDESR
jgi:hypothetical protein